MSTEIKRGVTGDTMSVAKGLRPAEASAIRRLEDLAERVEAEAQRLDKVIKVAKTRITDIEADLVIARDRVQALENRVTALENP